MVDLSQRGLGYSYVYDPRAAAYAMRDRLTSTDIERAQAATEILYEHGEILDQGEEGACTFFGHSAVVNAGPVKPAKPLTNADAFAGYERAKQIDEWPGEDYDGTSNQAAAKVMREQGYYEAFVWAANPEEMKAWILSGRGPVAFTTEWRTGMYQTDRDGILRFVGDYVGGHLMACIGYRPGFYVAQNSWGLGFGHDGICYIPDEEMVKMYRSGQWTCCTPTEKASVAPPKEIEGMSRTKFNAIPSSALASRHITLYRTHKELEFGTFKGVDVL